MATDIVVIREIISDTITNSYTVFILIFSAAQRLNAAREEQCMVATVRNAHIQDIYKKARVCHFVITVT